MASVRTLARRRQARRLQHARTESEAAFFKQLRSHLRRRKHRPRVLSAREAADVVGVSRRFMAERIAAGDIPLFRQSADECFVLASDVWKWHGRYKDRSRKAMIELAKSDDDLDAISGVTPELEGNSSVTTSATQPSDAKQEFSAEKSTTPRRVHHKTF